MPTFTEASEGEVISLKVVCTLNAELDKVSDVWMSFNFQMHCSVLNLETFCR